ncbi:SDR family NAD(P)-dependent oxidoreductase, partial [Candidatus Poribacteria bacterium]|nr:SDR family NAD(P)-dependent oxidoreductase [Candidatus Poribacteria bacterium]
CSEFLKPHIGLDLRDVLYPSEEGASEAAQQLAQTAIAQPALFVVAYALAKLWMEWGVLPQAMIGHSIGEYVAACLADVFSLEDALALVARRGKLMQQLPRGAMLAVALPEHEVRHFISEPISLAAINAPSRCVVSGPTRAVDKLERRFAKKGVGCRRLHTSHAFHSEMVAPILQKFTEAVKEVNLTPPQIPYMSNVTGTWITAAEATDAGYWARHLRQTVRFADGIGELLKEPERILLEVGPGRTLNTLVRQHPNRGVERVVLASLSHPRERQPDVSFLLNTLGKLWLAGMQVDWEGFYSHERRYRVPLPTYPFERQRYWLEQPFATHRTPEMHEEEEEEGEKQQSLPIKKPDIADWFYIPTWKRSIVPASPPKSKRETSCWLMFIDAHGLGEQLAKRLEQEDEEVITVKIGAEFKKLSHCAFTLHPRQSHDYESLLNELRALDKRPKKIVHFWNVTPIDNPESGLEWVDKAQNLGFYSLLFLAQALGKGNFTDELQIMVVSNNMQEVTGEELLFPEKATVLGPVRVIPKEYQNISCRSIDLVIPKSDSKIEGQLIDGLLAELKAESSDEVIAYRGNYRMVQTFEPCRFDRIVEETPQRLREGGVYLITGGLGGIGFALAEHLAKTLQARLILTGRSPFPARDEWEGWLAAHNEVDIVSAKIRKVQELEKMSAEVLVFSADVTDLEQMQSVITQSLEEFGEINGVIHAAGIPGGGMIQRKARDEAEQVMAPKVVGTLVLDTLLKDMRLDFFVVCSSLASIKGIFGQVDYAAGNAFLDAFAYHKSARDGTFAVSINWDTWSEVGMAVEAARHFSLSTDTQEPESQTVMHPLFDHCIVESSVREIYVSNFSVDKHWVLSEHRFAGDAVLPGTAYLEMARATFESHAKAGAIEIRDVYFLRPLTVREGEEKEVRTILKKQEDHFEFSIISQSDARENQWQEHAKGRIASIEAESPEKYNIKEIEAKCNAQEITIPKGEEAQIERLTLGERWNNLKEVKFGTDQGFAALELPEAYAADTDVYKLHPALLDTATAFLSIKVREDDTVYLPFFYKRLRIYRSLPPKVFSHIRVVENNLSPKETLRFNITIMDDRGVELVEIEDYTLRKVDLNRLTPNLSLSPRGEKSETENFSLEISTPGNLDTLVFQPSTRQKPGPGEVEIEVYATGLNFKDVLLALGMLPSVSDVRLKLGLECAGKIVALGEDVAGFEIGDEVIGFAPSSFSRFTTTPALMVALKPEHLSLEEGATIPAAFMTAYYALITLGRLSQGERVLIHAAAGGVGMAAVKIAQWIGAEIFATAGKPEKRAFLHSLGIEHVMDSRSLAFADEVMEYTNGRGVDVVLNSLAGEFIPKGLSVLAPYGRFLEIGVRDIYSNSKLGMRAFAKGISFFAIIVSPDIPNYSSIWREVVEHVKDGHFGPLPHREFPITRVTDAFEYMADAKHIGKIVVTQQDQALMKTLVVPQEGTMTAGVEKGNTITTPFSVGSDRHQITAESINVAQSNFLKNGLLSSEGIDVFNRILGNTIPQVVVSTQELMNRVEPVNALTEGSFQEGFPEINLSRPMHPRPEVSTTYVAPRNETEEILADIWQRVLGIEQIGIHDSFLELGGDSLLAVQLNTRLREHFPIDFSVHNFFDKPTIADMAEFIHTTDQTSSGDIEKIKEKLEMIEQLSDDEVKRLLAEMKS